MATIQKRTGKDGSVSYRAQVRLKGFPPESATFQRLTDAKAWAARMEIEIRAGRHFGHGRRRTFSDLLDEYEPYAATTLARFKDRQAQLSYWRRVFGPDRLEAITPARISKERDVLLATQTGRRDPATGIMATLSGTTAKAYLAALSAAFSYGVKTLQWVEKNPCMHVDKPRANDGRIRFLSDDERDRLLAACRASTNKDLYLAVTLALTTGAREAEIMSLHWHQIDFKRHVIHLHRTKNGDRRALPLVGEPAILLEQRYAVRRDDERVFPASARAKKSKYLDLRVPWEAAVEAAGLVDFHWHDLRHTAASFLVMNGVSLVEVAKVLGHRTLQMVGRYAHLADAHIVSTGQKLADRLGVGG